MKMIRRRHKRHTEAVELNVTPFMNLMIVLVPVLLLSMVFTHTTVIDLNFPSGGKAGDMDPESVHLEIQVLKNQLVVADQRSIIKRIPRLKNGQHDFEALSEVLQKIKNHDHYTAPLGPHQGRGFALGYWMHGGGLSSVSMSRWLSLW